MRRVVAAAALALALSAPLGVNWIPDAAQARQPEPDSFICHWTPAHGGFYVPIPVVNPNQALAHGRHVNDIVVVFRGDCEGLGVPD
jgi:hypothetical protein